MGDPASSLKDYYDQKNQSLDAFQVQTFNEDLRQLPKATFVKRLAAILIDGLVTSAAVALLSALATNLMGVPEKSIILFLSLHLLRLLYFVFMQYNSGQTLGKMVLKIKTIDDRTGGLPGLGQIFGREFLGRFLSGVTLLIGYLMALGEERKTLHDRIFQTSVVDLQGRDSDRAG